MPVGDTLGVPDSVALGNRVGIVDGRWVVGTAVGRLLGVKEGAKVGA